MQKHFKPLLRMSWKTILSSYIYWYWDTEEDDLETSNLYNMFYFCMLKYRYFHECYLFEMETGNEQRLS